MRVFATIKTKSNFKNMNGNEYEVFEMRGTRVTVIKDGDFCGTVNVDFTLNEIVSFRTEKI